MGNSNSISSQNSEVWSPSQSTAYSRHQHNSPYDNGGSSSEPRVRRGYDFRYSYWDAGRQDFSHVNRISSNQTQNRGSLFSSSSTLHSGYHYQTPSSSRIFSVMTPMRAGERDATLREPSLNYTPAPSHPPPASHPPVPSHPSTASRAPALVSGQTIHRASNFIQSADQANEQSSSVGQPITPGGKLISKWEDDLTCPICSDIYTNPLTLNCGHSFCKDCLGGWAIIQPPRTGYPGQFPCPLCKTTYPSSSIQTMQVNITLRNLCTGYKQQVEESKAMATKSELGAVSLDADKEKDYCKEHPTEEAKFVCLSCFVLFCGRCAVLSKMHIGEDHNVIEKKDAQNALKAVYEEYKKQGDELQLQASEASKTLQCEIHDLMSLEDEVNKQTEDLKKKVTTMIDKHSTKCRQKVRKFRKEHFDSVLNKNKQVDLKMIEMILIIEGHHSTGPIGNKLKPLANFIVESEKLEKEFQELFDALESLQKVSLKLQAHSFDEARLASLFDKKLFLTEEKVSRAVTRRGGDSEIAAFQTSKPSGTDSVRKKSSCSSLESESTSNVLPKSKRKRTRSKSSLGCGPILSTKGQSVKSMVASQFAEAKNYDLAGASWIFDFVVLLNIKSNDICAIHIDTGKLVCLIRGQQLPFVPCYVSAKLKGDTVIMFITGKSTAEGYASNVLMYKGPKDKLSSEDPRPWEICCVPAVYSLNKVKVFAHILCGITNDGIIKIGDIDGPAWDDKRFYPDFTYAEDIALRGSSKGLVLFVKGSGNVVQSKTVYGKEPMTQYDTKSLNGVGLVAPDKDDHLWIINKCGTSLSCFSNGGCLINQYNSPENICSIHFTKSLMMLLTKNSGKGRLVKIPLKSLIR